MHLTNPGPGVKGFGRWAKSLDRSKMPRRLAINHRKIDPVRFRSPHYVSECGFPPYPQRGVDMEVLAVASVILSAIGVGLGLASFILAHGRQPK